MSLDRWPFVLAATLTAIGLVNLVFVTSGTDGGLSGAARDQLVSAVVAVVGGLIASRVGLDRMLELAWVGWGLGVGLLSLVLAVGAVGGGARAWLLVGGSSLQPSEAMKLLVPLVLAVEIAAPRSTPARRAGAVAVAVGVPVVLIGLQPDLGAVGLIGFSAGVVLFVAGLPRALIVAGGLVAAVAAPVGWFALAEYQRDRIRTVFDPWRDPDGAGYQTIQAFQAVAAGGWTGRGPGAGTQGRLGFLPEHETDFILVALTEEWGFVGASVVLVLLFALVAAALRVAESAKDRFTSLLAVGLAGQFLGQVVVNGGGVLGLLPLTGVTLPFLSRGGSSLVVAWLSMGVLVACAREARRGSTLLERPVPLTLLRRPESERLEAGDAA
jgi:rod shape determining protein RodA